MTETEHTKIIVNKELSIWEALLPVLVLISLLSLNVYIFKDNATSGYNQFALLLAAAFACIIGVLNKVKFNKMIDEIATNIQSTTSAIIILLLVGSLTGTWLLSGVIPSMVYYGLQILHPSIFLPATLIICSIVAIATGSSWTTTATIGIAFIGIGQVMDINLGIVAGAVISGAYFGDKLSPMSDTTNLAPAMAGTDLFTHIRYMLITTIPTYCITLIIFTIIGFNLSVSKMGNSIELNTVLTQNFTITPWLFLVPFLVIVLIFKKVEPLIALFIGILLGAGFAVIFQPDLILKLSNSTSLGFKNSYEVIMNFITNDNTIEVSNEKYQKLFTSKGMAGMLNTIWLIICAMVFGGMMEAIGALTRITQSLLQLFHTTFGLFASTVASCLAINISASDQYLAIVVPGKMFAKAYHAKGLAPENLSRTLEDTGTVTSVLVPWNTCGAYQTSVLGVKTGDYFMYCFFNLISPFMTLLIAAIGYKIKMIKQK